MFRKRKLLFCLLIFSLKLSFNGFSQQSRINVYSSSDSLIFNELCVGFLKSYHQSSNAVGSLMLVQKKEFIWRGASGFSDLKKKTQFSANTPFHIGSISKTFLAVIVLQLIEEERFNLDDKVLFYLPELGNKIDGFEEITIRQLLSHTSGLIDPPNDTFSYKFNIVFAPKRFKTRSTGFFTKKYLNRSKLKFKPGSQYAYSNAGYWILEMLVEKLLQQKITQVLNERILEPLQLKETTLSTQTKVFKGYHQKRWIPSKWITSWDEAEAGGKMAGGLISTADDLRFFFSQLFDCKLINSNSLTEMKRIQLASCNSVDCEYGLGLELWRFDSFIGYGHNGTLIGAEANVLYFEDSQTLIVLFKNCGGGSDKRFIKDLIK
jgi:D-alanyl-D-alanine carboxypeptidase